jgi:hypothetical protein
MHFTRRKPRRLFHFAVGRWTLDVRRSAFAQLPHLSVPYPPTLASSSLFETFTILNCSAWRLGSGRNRSLPK